MGVSEAVLVTRPAGQAGRLCEELAAAGYRPVHQPLLAVSPVRPLDAAQRRFVEALDSYAHCLFVSANAARFGLDCVLDQWPEWPGSAQCYAVGDSTAAVLRAAGLPVLTPGENMTSEGLLALPSLQTVSGQRVLIIKGEGGRAALRQVLEERGARVDELRCYRRSAPDVSPHALQELLRQEGIRSILISSGEALENLTALLESVADTSVSSHVCTLVVPSSRVAEQARVAGWRDVVAAANASDNAMLAALQQTTGRRGKTVD